MAGGDASPLIQMSPFASQFENVESLSRDDLVYLARLAEQCERYDEMTDLMARVVRMSAESGQPENVLSNEERNIFSVACKNSVGARRASWRVFTTIHERKLQKNIADHARLAQAYKTTAEQELSSICTSILKLVDECILPRASAAESKVFYLKMKGDYYRYVAEFASGEKRTEAADLSKQNYTEAQQIAEADLEPTDPVRLGLALNYSVFYFEILNDSAAACALAKEAFDAAVERLDEVTGDTYRDSTLIMHLLRDNLSLWAPQPTASGGAQDGGDAAPAAPSADVAGAPEALPAAP